MASRAKWLLCALTCLAAVLTAATVAQAVDQTAKDGCTSPQPYSGSLITPAFSAPSGAQVNFQGWFEIESVAPTAFDTIHVEYTTPADAGVWTSFGDMTDPPSVQATPGGPDQPYSNKGTNVSPAFQAYSFALPADATGVANVQVRIRFDTVDQTYQGFRGVGIDSINITTATPPITADFENGIPAGWGSDPASGPGGPFWQAPTNPTSISVKNPEINPELVTLPDAGALPPPPSGGGNRYAWFGNAASGTFCGPDFGSREVGDVAPDTSITSGPPASTVSGDASFAFTATESAFFECDLDGGGFNFCASPQPYSGLADGTHTFSVRATDFTGNVDPTPATYTWTIRPATLADLPNPELGVDVNVQALAGVVKVGIPSAAARAAGYAHISQKGITFVPLSEAQQIPVGSFLDTRKGTVGLESAANRAGKRQKGKFLDGLFQVRQSKKPKAKGLTDLVLKGSSFSKCRGRGKGAQASLSRAQIRRLRARANGNYRTSGRNSSATVRGTIWDVTDRCDGTLTKVRRGRVVVRDFRRKRNIILTKGKSYLAKAPG
jgi:hypothetical protein